MIEVSRVDFIPGSREERLPEYGGAFPCVTTCCSAWENGIAPWHWHGAVELFYMESGGLEYTTPGCRKTFRAGMGGFLKSNVPHSSRTLCGGERQLLHLFDPVLISGERGSRIEEKYVLPLMTDGEELMCFSPEGEDHAAVLGLLKASFLISPAEPGYELKLRGLLSEIWLELLRLADTPAEGGSGAGLSDRVRQMLIFIHENYGEKISAADIAAAAHISEHLHTRPMVYLRQYRLRRACEMLLGGDSSVTEIGQRCGLGSGSYFARCFRDEFGISPLGYRKREREKK